MRKVIARSVLGLVVMSTIVVHAGSSAEAASWWKPKPGTSWQIQYTGRIDLRLDVDVYNLDLYETRAATIASLQDDGRRVICYFSAGSYEDWRPDASRFPDAAIGEPLDGWDGEWWLDIRNSQVKTLMKKRLDLAVNKGCNGVDPDNVEAYAQDSGFNLTSADQITYNTFLTTEAHKRGLAIGLKNDLKQINQLVELFDFAVNEECFYYDECALLKPFITSAKPVFTIEYGSSTTARRVCPTANTLNFDTLIKNVSLVAKRTACR